MYWRSVVNVMFMAADALMFVIAVLAVQLFRDDLRDLNAARINWLMPMIVGVLCSAVMWVVSLSVAGIYHRHVMGDGYQVNVMILKAGIICWFIQCAFSFVADLDLALAGLNLALALGVVLTMIERMALRPVVVRTRNRRMFSYATAVVGSPEGIRDTLDFLGQRQQLSYHPVVVCPIRWNARDRRIEADRSCGAADFTSNGTPIAVVEYAPARFTGKLAEAGVQTVMVCDVLHRFSDAFNTFSVRMESMGMEVALITSAADAAGHETQIRSMQDTTILTLRLPQYSAGTRIVKRVFDVALSVIALVASAIVTVPVAIAIKLTDGGPVFYTQRRIGLRGEPFDMIKFRSMVVNADALKAQLAKDSGQEGRFIFKMKDDPRITPVGKFIRRFSIDELPQFINVLRGDMSIVGPRPPLPEEHERYNQIYATRMLVKPGITGPWQVSGRSDLSAEESERLDVSYVQNWSIVGDIVLMLRTVSAVAMQRGAY
ncbi:sugar transferase [Bifidobacterium sp. 82T10]|uniref:Sugar transferase n=2 Tax=Bifidobacterium miconis TaxID=2834435 RepID=A0ABS6WEQ9_9BIFI|nr:sugar transferase [Bifidobacterium miconis]MBW3091731.1 sugar transferase [Bifidobacterium miconis]